MSRTLVVGEPGCTAEGDYDTYLRLIETAAACGCDVIKPQWVSDPIQMLERRHITADHPKRAYYERAYRWLNFPIEWHADFKELAHKLGMQYACTAFLPQDVPTLNLSVDHLKIASFENHDEAMRLAAVATGKRTFISAGMNRERPTWPWLSHFRWLHCVSSYPVPLEEINLRAIFNEAEWGEPGWLEGLSDHTRDLDVGAFAVCAGAQIIEAHFRLTDCHPDNPDYAVAFEPGELTVYIQRIRKAERAMGSCRDLQPSEAWALPYRVTG